MKKALELGEGKDMGTWETMSGKKFMKWWRESNWESNEYLNHKEETDKFIGE